MLAAGVAVEAGVAVAGDGEDGDPAAGSAATSTTDAAIASPTGSFTGSLTGSVAGSVTGCVIASGPVADSDVEGEGVEESDSGG